MCEALIIIGHCFLVQIYFLLACAKGVVGGAISGAVQLVAFLLIALALLPHDIAVTYYTAAKTKMIGPWLKTLCMLLLPVPLLTWPIWAALAGLLVGFCMSLSILVSARADNMRGSSGDAAYDPSKERKGRSHGPWPGVCDWLCLPITGWGTACEETARSIKSFADFNYNSFFAYLQEVRNHPGPPFDISPVRLVASLGVAVVGLVLGLVCALVQVPKFPFILIKVWYEMVKSYVQIKDFTGYVLIFVPFLLGLALAPAGLVLVLALLLTCLPAVGFMWAGIKGYQAPTMADMAWHGTAHVWNLCHELEKGVDEFTGIRCFALFGIELPLPAYRNEPSPARRRRYEEQPSSAEGPDDDVEKAATSTPRAGGGDGSTASKGEKEKHGAGPASVEVGQGPAQPPDKAPQGGDAGQTSDVESPIQSEGRPAYQAPEPVPQEPAAAATPTAEAATVSIVVKSDPEVP